MAKKPRKKRVTPVTPEPAPADAAAEAQIDSSPAATISAEELCAFTGLTDRRHRQLAKSGYFPPPLRGLYQKDKTITGLFLHFREQLHKRDNTLRLEQQKLTRTKRETAEEKLAIIRKQYVLKSEIGPALRNVSLHQRATLQFKLENELAPNLAGKTADEIIRQVRNAVDAICSIFQEGIRPWLNSAP
jgi:hypothetical protein